MFTLFNMLLVKDAMVLIHLAKTSLLEISCQYFGRVFVPPKVEKEVDKPNYVDAVVIRKLIREKKIEIKSIADKSLVRKAEQLGIYCGEAEAVALYWEQKADLLATDDDNVRKKKELIHVNLIGTPVIILELYKEKRIDKVKLREAVRKMKEIGWFQNTIWDKIMLEAEHE